MANWGVATFAVLMITVLMVLAALILIIIQIVNPALLGTTSTTATTTIQTSSNNTAGATVETISNDGPSSATAWGSGKDGDLSLTNQTNIRLDKDAFYRNLTLDNCILETSGYRLFVSDTLTMLHGSTIRNQGQNGMDNDRASPSKGGKGAAEGSLGGGGPGGDGLLVGENGSFGELAETMNGTHARGGYHESGDSSAKGLGANASSFPSQRVPGGIGGSRAGSASRSSYETLCALTPSFVPTMPLLGGGSGGGGGAGLKGYPGSGGGGGGGVIIVVAKSIVIGEGGGMIDASGGSGGALQRNGPTLSGAASRYPPATATRGGGGGGGLVLVSTLSDHTALKRDLTINVAGGQSGTFEGRVTYAESGHVVFWHDHAESSAAARDARISLSHPATQSLKAGIETTLMLSKEESSAHMIFDRHSGQISVRKSGMYLVTAHMEVPAGNVGVRAWLRRNEATGEYARLGEAAAHAGRLDLSSIISLGAGDRFDLRLRSLLAVDVNASLDSPSSVNAVLISPL